MSLLGRLRLSSFRPRTVMMFRRRPVSNLCCVGVSDRRAQDKLGFTHRSRAPDQFGRRFDQTSVLLDVDHPERGTRRSDRDADCRGDLSCFKNRRVLPFERRMALAD